ncbi:hypothetical protein E2C01_020098 [Portunus trituberculatus]|uniref:Uncharacterized protein n=1 Tax=Portunus trituberculatus TaxID=210409 RepID=A0A5B7E173_PORTR|nr:hypothetical protein [Portunus trituberculatus]
MCYGLKVGKRFYPFLLAHNALLAAGVACEALLSNPYPSHAGRESGPPGKPERASGISPHVAA